MKISGKLLEFGQYYLQKDLSLQAPLLEEDQFSLNREGMGCVKCNQLFSNDFLLLDVQMKFNRPCTDCFNVDGESVVMNFFYDCNVKADIEEIGQSEMNDANTHNVLYTPNFKGTFRMLTDVPVNMLIIILSKEFYFSLIPKDSDFHKEFSENISKKKACNLSNTYLPFTPGIQSVIQDIKKCRYEGGLKRLYIENKIQELLLLQLDLYQQYFTVAKKHHIKEADFVKLKEAKHLLDSNFVTAPNLHDLSKQVYLNEYKLKKGFKICFGTSVKKYIIELRMKRALELLKEEKYSISEIAYLCGYNGLVQFSTAFKSYYGHSPKNMGNHQCKTK